MKEFKMIDDLPKKKLPPIETILPVIAEPSATMVDEPSSSIGNTLFPASSGIKLGRIQKSKQENKSRKNNSSMQIPYAPPAKEDSSSEDEEVRQRTPRRCSPRGDTISRNFPLINRMLDERSPTNTFGQDLFANYYSPVSDDEDSPNVNMICVNTDSEADSESSDFETNMTVVCPITRKQARRASSTSSATTSASASHPAVQTRAMKRRSVTEEHLVPVDATQYVPIRSPQVKRKYRVPATEAENAIEQLVESILHKEATAQVSLQCTGLELQPCHELSTFAEMSQLQEMVGFWMGKYEVTKGEYLALMGNNPSGFQPPNATADTNRPVETVSCHDATNYCTKLTERERLAGRIPTNCVYWLPTEAGVGVRVSFGDLDAVQLRG